MSSKQLHDPQTLTKGLITYGEQQPQQLRSQIAEFEGDETNKQNEEGGEGNVYVREDDYLDGESMNGVHGNIERKRGIEARASREREMEVSSEEEELEGEVFEGVGEGTGVGMGGGVGTGGWRMARKKRRRKRDCSDDQAGYYDGYGEHEISEEEKWAGETVTRTASGNVLLDTSEAVANTNKKRRNEENEARKENTPKQVERF